MKESHKRYKWWCRFPGEVYANDFCFREPVNERDARAYIRAWLGGGKGPVARLPPGTQIWPGVY